MGSKMGGVGSDILTSAQDTLRAREDLLENF